MTVNLSSGGENDSVDKVRVLKTQRRRPYRIHDLRSRFFRFGRLDGGFVRDQCPGRRKPM